MAPLAKRQHDTTHHIGSGADYVVVDRKATAHETPSADTSQDVEFISGDCTLPPLLFFLFHN
jgi:hypothetical protein